MTGFYMIQVFTERYFQTDFSTGSLEPIKCQCCPHIEPNQLIWYPNHLTSFYMMSTLVFNGLKTCLFLKNKVILVL